MVGSPPILGTTRFSERRGLKLFGRTAYPIEENRVTTRMSHSAWCTYLPIVSSSHLRGSARAGTVEHTGILSSWAFSGQPPQQTVKVVSDRSYTTTLVSPCSHMLAALRFGTNAPLSKSFWTPHSARSSPHPLPPLPPTLSPAPQQPLAYRRNKDTTSEFGAPMEATNVRGLWRG